MIITTATASNVELVDIGDIRGHLGWAPSAKVPARVILEAYRRVCGPYSIFGYCFRKWVIEATAYQWPFDNTFRLHPPVQGDQVTFSLGGTDYDIDVRGETGEAYWLCPDGYEAGTAITAEYTAGEETTGTTYVPHPELQTAVLIAIEALITEPGMAAASERAIAHTLRQWNRLGRI